MACERDLQLLVPGGLCCKKCADAYKQALALSFTAFRFFQGLICIHILELTRRKSYCFVVI
jgi:hypothetical protein